MSDIAIRVEGLSKRYRIGGQQEPYRTLRDTLVSVAAAPLRYARSALRRPGGESLDGGSSFWALRDVSFEVRRGEVVGIIGRNGAGKSTLLKILSRITEPTSGYADIYGRVGSLLEVGTGFHPELTGRENIYLNGAILGMKRTEIGRKFDEIVAFAEIERFIDTPVKHYSSGMYLRLAFAVAAHLEPEILLVDEVLAVGDAAFQKKCLGKMGEVAQEGRTVLFVSHNMSAVGRLCSKAIYLDQGALLHIGETKSIITAYLASSVSADSQYVWPDITSAPGDEFIRAMSVAILDEGRVSVGKLHQDQSFFISITYKVLKSMMNANVGFEIKSEEGITVFTSFDADNPAWSGIGRREGIYISECAVPAHLLNEGVYYLTLLAGIPHLRLCMMTEDIVRLDVGPSTSGDGPSGRMGARRSGLVAPELDWQVILSTT